MLFALLDAVFGIIHVRITSSTISSLSSDMI